jgi:hypothetical protein
MPVTSPAASTVALAALLLLHVSPPDALRVVVLPIHTEAVPVIAAGSAFTVTSRVEVQPELIS